jgi:catechol 2,3-dioxygenase-like lactoylglutathione lyase family enzyme
MIDHLGIKVREADRSLPFYEACLAPLGIRKVQDQPQWRAAVFAAPDSRTFLWIGAGAPDELAITVTSYFHLAFVAKDEAAVAAFHAAALAAGGTDNGGPGLRRPGYYAAFVHDPDGNNIEAAFRPS